MIDHDSSNSQTGYFEQLCDINLLRRSFKAVKRNKGAPGIDGVSVEAFEFRLEQELSKLQEDVQCWVYRPSAVRRVEIAKPNGGVRLLGIPTVRDRVLQMAIKSILEPVFEPVFSDHSYGFRPGRNQEQAVKAAQKIVQSGKEFVVDIDLSKFFDRIHHDRLIWRIKQFMPDRRLLRLIGLILRSGVMHDGLVSSSYEGAPQGGPLSPLLSNIVLDELDKELERRGLSFCRFADDCNIFCGSEKSAQRVMNNVTKFIERRLRLAINQEKSKVAKSCFVKFLGMTITSGQLAISLPSFRKAMAKTRELTPRGTNKTIEQTVKEINQWYGGWANYFRMTQYPSQLQAIEAHIRRRLRSRFVDQQKTRRNLYRKIISLGVSKRHAKIVFTNRRRWALAHTRALEKALPNLLFTGKLGLTVLSDQRLPHWYPVYWGPKLRKEPYT